MHELATNAVKYGALASLDGRLQIDLSREGQDLHLIWAEQVASPLAPDTGREGFGTTLEKAALQGLDGQLPANGRQTA